MAKELGSRTALSVVVLERGGPRKTDDYGDDMDELDYAIRLRMMQDTSQETVTLRHDKSERALPLRQHGSFLPGSGVGGAGEHWNGLFPRVLPDCFELNSRIVEKYGAKRLPEDHAIQDWGGDTLWRAPVTHAGENIGNTEAHALLVEPKDACKWHDLKHLR